MRPACPAPRAPQCARHFMRPAAAGQVRPCSGPPTCALLLVRPTRHAAFRSRASGCDLLCLCLSVCLCVWMSVFVRLCVDASVRVLVCLRVCVSLCLCVCVLVCRCVCVLACVSVPGACVHVCLSAFLCVFVTRYQRTAEACK